MTTRGLCNDKRSPTGELLASLPEPSALPAQSLACFGRDGTIHSDQCDGEPWSSSLGSGDAAVPRRSMHTTPGQEAALTFR